MVSSSKDPGTTVVVVTQVDESLPREDISTRFRLTPREAEVARQLAKRYSNKQIPKVLRIDLKTLPGNTSTAFCQTRSEDTSSRHGRPAYSS